MVTWTFQARVEYAVPVPVVPGFESDAASTISRRRASGINILRPTAASTRKRPALSIIPVAFTPADALAVLVDPEPALDAPPNLELDGPAPETPTAEVEALEALVPKPPREAYTAQRATLRHVKSLGHIKLDALSVGADTVQQLVHGPERDLARRWASGRVQVVVHGEGGEGGGELSVIHADERHPLLVVPLPDIAESPWAIDAVQRIHRSVSHRAHSLSLLLPPLEPMDGDMDDLPVPAGSSPATPSALTPKKAMDDVKRSFARLGRLRAKTLVGQKYSARRAAASSVSLAGHDRHLSLAFSTDREAKEWAALLRAFAGAERRRMHRRLKIWVLDLLEAPAAPGAAAKRSVADDAASSSYMRECSVETQSRDDTAYDGGRVTVRAGWASKERIRIELAIDGRLVARTAWTRGEAGGTPFWGEQLALEGIPEFSTCDLVLFRQLRSGRATPFGIVRLPLVPSFAMTDDERFPIRALDGAVIGELRLSVAFDQVAVLPRDAYLAAQSDVRSYYSMPIDLVYRLALKGCLEGTAETMARLGFASGGLLGRLLEMCTFEARATGATLFRGTTPLTKSLEAAMRLLCGHFLEASIGPTIRHVTETRLVVRLHSDAMGRFVSTSGIADMSKLVERCWRDMYAVRHLFPDLLRHVFAHLFKEVKEAHDDRSEKLRYKAVSCFVFLRLIGPALMRPHLFGLTDGLVPPEQQRALTLVARVLHVLAFFSDKDMKRDPELGLFQGFIRSNNDMMIDYLASFATPLDDWQSRPAYPSVTSNFLCARAARLPAAQAEAIPTLTIAGPIDVCAELAVVHETLWARSQAPRTGRYMALASLGKKTDQPDKADKADATSASASDGESAPRSSWSSSTSGSASSSHELDGAEAAFWANVGRVHAAATDEGAWSDPHSADTLSVTPSRASRSSTTLCTSAASATVVAPGMADALFPLVVVGSDRPESFASPKSSSWRWSGVRSPTASTFGDKAVTVDKERRSSVFFEPADRRERREGGLWPAHGARPFSPPPSPMALDFAQRADRREAGVDRGERPAAEPRDEPGSRTATAPVSRPGVARAVSDVV
ncbi:hypothetical protein Q5752_003198 [Cryptotrichosporon argae]